MRGAFIEELTRLARYDERVVVLTGDLGYTVLEQFRSLFPDRFYNVGVAEQNMVGVATGLAEAGYIPFVYSIATFASLRAYEFIRNGPIWQRLPVRIVGIGGGFEYGTLGLTHYALEDVGLFRLQPEMTVLVPADDNQVVRILRKTWDLPGPIYYRLSKKDLPPIKELAGKFSLGRAEVLRRGKDILGITMGTFTRDVLGLADKLARGGVSMGVMSVASVAPAPLDQLKRELKKVPLAFTLEAHYTIGGLGTLVAEVIADNDLPCRLVRYGVGDRQQSLLGSEPFLLKQHRLTETRLVRNLLKLVSRGKKHGR